MTTPKKSAGDGGMLPIRTVVAILFAAVVGVVAGCLSFLITKSVAAATLTGGGAFGAALMWINHLMGPE